jgi:16S rRNA U516 pseudouridylate synthase RsuA-like enzyme
MNIQLDTEVGQWRYLSDKELERLNELLDDSSKINE